MGRRKGTTQKKAEKMRPELRGKPRFKKAGLAA